MTQSAVCFKGKHVFIQDPDLRAFLSCLGQNLKVESFDDLNDFEWMLAALVRWIDEHKKSPPGLRDVTLDEVLLNPDRQRKFVEYMLESVQSIAGGAHERDRAGHVARRLIEGLSLR